MVEMEVFTMTHPDQAVVTDRREMAITRLKKKRDFLTHVVAYTTVNTFLVLIWLFTGAAFFWPVFPILGWGIGLALNAWDVYGRKDISEEEISREMRRMP